MPPTVLTVADVAELLQVAPGWVYDHRRELGGFRLGAGKRAPIRFRPERIDAYLAVCSAAERGPVEPLTSALPRQASARNRRQRVTLLPAATGLQPECTGSGVPGQRPALGPSGRTGTGT